MSAPRPSKPQRADTTLTRIHRLMTRRGAFLLLTANLLTILLVLVGWCYATDSAYLGRYNPFVLFSSLSRSLVLRGGKLLYTVAGEDLAPLTVDATLAALIVFFALLLLVLLELVAAAISSGTGLVSVRKQLEPLYNLTRAAQRLSDEDFSGSQGHGAAPPAPPQTKGPVRTEDDRIHTLESALEEFRPERPDALLYTGDQDLRGLEDAINSLIARTRDSYSQQIRFVSDASHELRTPIAVIKGYTDMLHRWGKEDERILNESIEAIQAETEHMNRLVEQLLFLARGDSGRQKLSLTPFSLSDLLVEICEEFAMIDPGHRWEHKLSGPVTVTGDEALLKQAVRILADNACKYTPAGEAITLTAGYDAQGVPFVSVTDGGVGIPKDDLAHVFERFYRSDQSRSRQQGGTGLGLAIAKWIVDRHGGYFDVLSREGLGTRFTIRLPASGGPAPAPGNGEGDRPATPPTLNGQGGPSSPVPALPEGREDEPKGP